MAVNWFWERAHEWLVRYMTSTGMILWGKGGGAPNPPDPYTVSAAQAGQNADTALYTFGLNNPNVKTPLGSQSYQVTTHNGAPPTVDQNVTLSPAMQQNLDLQLKTASGANQLALNQMPAVQQALSSGPPQASAAVRDKTEQALMSRMDPYFQHEQSAMDAKLAAEGVDRVSNPGAAAWAQTQFDQSKNDARMQAIINAGGAEQQQLQMDIAAQQAPINELSALETAGQTQSPQFQGLNQTGVGATNLANNVYQSYQGQNDVYNAKQASNNATTSALGSLGAAGILAYSSDENIKEDRKPAGKVLDKLDKMPVDKWRYKPEAGLGTDEHIGPMAQDVHNMFGFGDGKSIPVVDMFGMTMSGMKELHGRMKKLEQRA